MTTTSERDVSLVEATDGMIAAINLESARRGAWQRWRCGPRSAEMAEAVVDLELSASQYLGDLDALDRMENLATELDDTLPTAALVLASIASATHRFADAMKHLVTAQSCGASTDIVLRQTLNVQQACGANLETVLATRRRRAATRRIEDLIPLGALLADLDEFEEADCAYREAIEAYGDVSPLPLAWACFQLGMLWGEHAPDPDFERAALWYRRAIAYLPCYVKARVHLAEICLKEERNCEAMELLKPALETGDPEVHWRIADALLAQNLAEEGRMHLESARLRYEELLARHLLAFADHAADFYTGSGDNAPRALELVRANVTNRPTRRARAQLREIALTMEVTA
jgi:tetratricopeptide (TPR) repeat protein